MKHELALVMPVYNEEECIEQVVASWRSEFARLGVDFVMLVLNDGSRDRTAEVLAGFASDSRIQVTNKPNSGHGPTILQGYRCGADLAQWVFQTDSDDEMKPEHFGELWRRREQYDALMGFRHGREQSRGRSLISFVSRQAVRLCFGGGVVDVNTPYRLIRSSLLQEIVRDIPDDTFAPNVVISGMLARKKARIYNHPVPHEGRRTGSVSIVRWKLWKAALRSLLQTVRLSRSLGR